MNDELRVDMKAFNNFLLIQDEEWAELLHGLKVLEGQTEKYSEDELQKVRQELFEDLERKAQLKKDGSLMKDKAFREVYDYVKSLLPEATPVPSQE